jgi:cysteine-rich repeat protein
MNSIKTFEIILGYIDMSTNKLSSNSSIIYNTFFGYSSFVSIDNNFFKIDLWMTNNFTLKNRDYFNYQFYIIPYLTFSTVNKYPLCCHSTPFYDGLNTCLDICPLSYYSTIENYCVKCPLFDCLTCNNATACTKCGLGKIVNGFCTKVSGCIKVDSTINSTTNNCLQCSEEFIYDNVSRTCNCAQGFWLVTDLCTDNYGCVFAHRVENKTICRSCDYNHFQLVGNYCECEKGFAFNNQTNTCEEVCGDGKLFSHVCDDGNTLDGDGCSAECTV